MFLEFSNRGLCPFRPSCDAGNYFKVWGSGRRGGTGVEEDEIQSQKSAYLTSGFAEYHMCDPGNLINLSEPCFFPLYFVNWPVVVRVQWNRTHIWGHCHQERDLLYWKRNALGGVRSLWDAFSQKVVKLGDAYACKHLDMAAEEKMLNWVWGDVVESQV